MTGIFTMRVPVWRIAMTRFWPGVVKVSERMGYAGRRLLPPGDVWISLPG
jgi:hypothetical protein